MTNTRLIARLDIKGPNLIKGIHLEGLRVIGSPNEHALRYYQHGADELIYMDCVASLYGRNHLADIIRSAVENIFVPMTVGGGIRSVEDAVEADQVFTMLMGNDVTGRKQFIAENAKEAELDI